MQLRINGLFISDSTLQWNWQTDINTTGRTNSQYRFFYDKVESLLCWSIYYTACAMQYCLNKAKENDKDKEINPNYFVDNPEDRLAENYAPSDRTQIPIDDFLSMSPETKKRDKLARNFKNLAKLLSPLAFLGITYVLRETALLLI